MAEQISNITTKDLKGRVLLGGLILAALVFAWLSISWQIGNLLGSITQPNDPNAREIGQTAYSLSSRDPIVNWLNAGVETNISKPENLNLAVADLERAVTYAPDDYRYWVELGRAFEQVDNYEKSEKAFKRAVEVAPNYGNVHWHLGNFYLRRGRETESFDELRKAADANTIYSEQVFALVWDFYDHDKSKLEQVAGEKGAIRANLARFYASRELAEDSLRIWNTISEPDKQRNQSTARVIAQSLYEKRFFRSAIEFMRQTGIEPEAQAETIENNGFESPIASNAGETYFGWKIIKKDKIEINTDPTKKKGGNKSLRLSFNGFTGIELKNILQIVAVEPNKKYRLSFWLKTDNLRSAGTPTLEIVNSNDEKIITTSAAFASGTQDWTAVNLEFTTPPNAQAIGIRFDRAYCGEACPIVGTLWVDDFKLKAV